MLNLLEILETTKSAEEENVKEKQFTPFKEDERILTLKKGNRYYGRIIPYMADPKKTFVTYEKIGLTSRTTGKYIFAGRSPSNAKIPNDIWKKTQFDEYNRVKGDKAAEKITQLLFPIREQMVNFYLTKVVGDDEEAKAKIGTVVIFRYPAKLNYKDKTKPPVPASDIYKLIDDALYGDEKDKYGAKLYDLGPKGRSLIIKITEKDGWKCYSESKIDDAEDLGLAKKQVEEIYNSAHNLEDLIPELKSQEDLKKILDEHYFGTKSSVEDELDDEDTSEDDEDDLPGLEKSKSKGKDGEDDELDEWFK